MLVANTFSTRPARRHARADVFSGGRFGPLFGSICFQLVERAFYEFTIADVSQRSLKPLPTLFHLERNSGLKRDAGLWRFAHVSHGSSLHVRAASECPLAWMKHESMFPSALNLID
jgi:hypothetical protein